MRVNRQTWIGGALKNMMSLKIYEMEHSPYCIPITQALTALGVDFERVAVPNWDRSAVIQATGGAYYQVPVLQHGDKVIYESSDKSLDIAHYIDTEFAHGRLFPADSAGLQEILVEHIENELESYAFRLCDIHYLPAIDDLVGRTMSLRHKERRFGRDCVDRWRADKMNLKAELDRLLARFDQTLRHRDFLLGTIPQYVDFALLGSLGNYTYRGYNKLAEEQNALSAWVERIRGFRYP